MTPAPGWIPVSLSSAVEAGTSAGAVVDGKECVVWRDTSGAAHVWEDRCPHRGMRLSFGFVRGDHIACLYHGWQYDTAGQCRLIPAHPDMEVPKTIKVPAYATIEAGGVIWSSLTEEAPAPMDLTDGPATPVRSLYVDRDLGSVIGALGGLAVLAPVAASSTAFIAEIGSDRLLVAGQRIGSGRCALHLALLGAGVEVAHVLALSRWAEALRHALETGAAAPAIGEAA